MMESMQRIFPLQELPPELQMLVLCKCDLISVVYLLNLDPNLKALFLLHPQSYLRQIIRSLPSPIGNFLCFAHLLDLVSYLRPDDLLGWIRKANSAQDVLTSESWILETTDSLNLLYKLADFMEDIDEAVTAYADAVLAVMDTVSVPNADHRSIPLSLDEYVRLTSSFMLLHILDKSVPNPSAYYGLPRRVMDAFPTWQVEQVNAVAEFLDRTGRHNILIYTLVDAKYSSRSYLHDVSRLAWAYKNGRHHWMGSTMAYVHGYLNVDAQSAYSYRFTSTVSPVLGSDRPYYNLHDPRSTIPRQLGTALIMPTQGDDFPSLSSTPTKAPSTSEAPIPAPPGWTFLTSLTTTAHVSRSVYTDIFIDLGLFFWDADRLWQMGIADVEDFGDVVDNMAAAQARAHIAMYDKSRWDGSWVRSRTVEHWLVEWTRSGATCSFGEWVNWRGEGRLRLPRG